MASQTIDEPLRPIEALIDSGGWVVMLGTDFVSCTLIHVAEHAAGRRYFVRWSIDAAGRVFPRARVRVQHGVQQFRAGRGASRPRDAHRRRAGKGFSGEGVTARRDAGNPRGPGDTLCPGACTRCRDAVAGGPTSESLGPGPGTIGCRHVFGRPCLAPPPCYHRCDGRGDNESSFPGAILPWVGYSRTIRSASAARRS